MNDLAELKKTILSHRNVPVRLAAELLGVSQEFIRCGLIRKELPFGSAFRLEGSSRYTYHISPVALIDYYEYGTKK